MSTFVHLQVHTDYSIVDGIARVDALVEAAVQCSMPALAITDMSNLFAMVKFYRAAVRAGIKPIIGVDVWVTSSHTSTQTAPLTLLCQDAAGFQNLNRLLTYAYQSGQQQGIPCIERAALMAAPQGLIALSGWEGEVGTALRAGNTAMASERLKEWRAAFSDRFYVTITSVGLPHEKQYIPALLSFAIAHTLPVVATNLVRFIAEDDFEAHEARVCIHQGRVLEDPQRPQDYTSQQYFRSSEEMQALFAEIPTVLENSLAIAQRCNFRLSLEGHCLPHFPVPEDTSLGAYFGAAIEAGLQQRFPEQSPESRGHYRERLAMESKVIQSMGFAGYFLIVADFIRWAKTQNIPVGPGRGSGAGSLVAYVLGITDIDPIPHHLLFERFLNPERVSMPDFDIDFCMEGRDRVIQYVAQRYGRQNVSQIITYGTMAARAVLRDVGRVLGYPYRFVDTLAKLVPFEIGITLRKALQQEEQLQARYQNEPEVQTLIQLAVKLEGVPRNVSKHAGGVVISPSALTDFTPLYCEEDGSNLVTQLDKDDIERIGLVKFDFLGLRTLTIIHWAVQCINERHASADKQPLSIANIPLEDEATFALLNTGATEGIFQLESRGMRDLIQRLQPHCFNDIVSLVALFRPGPLQSGMVDDFIDRKHGRARVTYPHPDIEPILEPTYGVILYQEQVMQIAQVLAGYTLGKADLLRRAMGKKKASEMAEHRALFIEGTQQRGVDTALASMIFDLMEKFAGYGFNKSHSVAYALLSYQTAWLKTHYPAEFMAAVLSADMDNTDKVVGMIRACQALQLIVEPPDINRSDYRFLVESDRSIRYGLGAIKGVGESAGCSIVAQRHAQAYQSVFDLCMRVDTRKCNRRVLEALVRSGAMDCFSVSRASLAAALALAIQAAEQHHRNRAYGQTDLFSEQPSGLDATFVSLEYPAAEDWPDAVRLQGEKETLGRYLSGHPIAAYAEELAALRTDPLNALERSCGKSLRIAGYVCAVRTLLAKNGQRIAFVSLEDTVHRVDVGVLGGLYSTCRDILIKDSLLVVEGKVSADNYSGGYRLVAKQIYTLDQARAQWARVLRLFLDPETPMPLLIETLRKFRRPSCDQTEEGYCRVWVDYYPSHSAVEGHGSCLGVRMRLGDAWRLRVSQEALDALKSVCGKDRVEVVY